MERLPGFRDFYPEPLPHQDVWSASLRTWLFARWREAARRYSFAEYDAAPLEPLELYTLKSGPEIVGQLYNFSDKGDRAVAMRPEMTPSLARMAAAHERNYKKPLKWFSIPQLFRYERQQKGRLREHFQFNADILGEPSIHADAELICLLADSLRLCGLTQADFYIRISSRAAWEQFYATRASNLERAGEFYQVIDKLEREDPAESDARLKALGFDLQEVRDFIQAAEPTDELRRLMDLIAAAGLAEYVKLDYGVIRGLAYYTGVVFEAFDRKGEFRAIAGGGRYDKLIHLVSGGKVDLPALGFGMGDVVLTELLKERKLLPNLGARVDVYLLMEDETRRPELLRLAQRLREQGCAVEYSLTPLKPDKQFKRALELNSGWTVKTGPEPGKLVLKNLKTREENQTDAAGILEVLRKTD